jgi:hypothetical protein
MLARTDTGIARHWQALLQVLVWILATSIGAYHRDLIMPSRFTSTVDIRWQEGEKKRIRSTSTIGWVR